MAPGEYCVCGNMLANATVPIVMKPCRCAKPGRAQIKSTLPSALKGMVRKTWDDVFEDQGKQELENAAAVRERHQAREAGGDRVVW
jgi:hypothetical protein